MRELRTGTPITLAGVTLTPIERTKVDCNGPPGACWFHATKDPVAVVISGPEGIRALDVFARELSIEELTAQVPELETILQSIAPSPQPSPQP